MSVLTIIGIVFAYLAIGAFTSGLGDFNRDWCPDPVVMIFWPLICVVAAFLWVFSWPMKLGEWIHDRFFW